VHELLTAGLRGHTAHPSECVHRHAPWAASHSPLLRRASSNAAPLAFGAASYAFCVARQLTIRELLNSTPFTDEQLHRYAMVVGFQPRRDYLDAIDSERRSLTLYLRSDRLLRVAETGSQARVMGRLRRALRDQIREQMVGRRAFRGPVSVEIDLHATSVRQPPSSPPSVKAYLDLLGKRGEEGLVYPDDEVVRHLRVRRHAPDHPIHRAQPEDWIHMGQPSFPWGPDHGVEARIVLRPLRLYISDFDRLWRRSDQIFDRARSSVWDRDEPAGARFWAHQWDDLRDHDRLAELRREDRDDVSDSGLYAPGGLFDASPEMRAIRMDDRRRRQRETKALLDRLLLDQRPGELDRPGPVAEIDQLTWAHVPELVAMKREHPVMPGVFYLPLPTESEGGPDWAQVVRREMEAHRVKTRVLGRPLDTPLSLDISVRGATSGRKDYDNLAHIVLPAFEQIFCADVRGTVVSYRVYESDGDEPAVRVMVTTDQRLQDMEDAIATSRDWVLRHGPALLRMRH
jgi:Holliday junction resolvase RusA-like endonuclease